MDNQRHATLKRDYYGDDAENPDNHNIHLEGSFDFKRTLDKKEAFDTLRKRAEQVGGLATLDGNRITVSCLDAMEFDLIYKNDELVSIKSKDVAEDESVTHTIEELEEMAKETEGVVEALEDAEWKIEKDNERKNIMDM